MSFGAFPIINKLCISKTVGRRGIFSEILELWDNSNIYIGIFDHISHLTL